MLTLKGVILILACNTGFAGYCCAQETTKENSISYSPDRKLKYLYAAEGHLMGFFDDGTVSQCEQCEFCPETVDALKTTPPALLYEIEGDVMTVYENKDAMDALGIPMEDNEHWIIINFKQEKQIPDCR